MTTPRTHIYVLLDRSGSMKTIREDVIGGFNTFLSEQAADGTDARMTVVQFDNQEPHEVVVDAKRIDRVPELSTGTFVPRGMTPLLDATGRIIEQAAHREVMRSKERKKREEIVIVTVTDGHENNSRAFSRDDIRTMVREKEAKGWTFVYLSADLEAYDEARSLGYDDRSVSGWSPDRAGARMAFRSMSRATRSKRQKDREGASYDRSDFFEGVKEAEQRPNRTSP